MQNKINRLYGSLKSLEEELLKGFTPEQRDEYLNRLNLLEHQALKIKVSKRMSSDYYTLRSSIDYVRNCINRGVQPYQINAESVEIATQVLKKVEPLEVQPPQL